MYAAAKAAIDRARDGAGPTLLEAVTFRFYGHVFGDSDAYIPKAVKEAAMARDPVVCFRAWLVERKYASDAELQQMEAGLEKEIDEAVEFALASPYPDVAELGRDVFAVEQPL
jgi:pyruvate dehydrogenase E1 component alpha subunit